MNHTDETAGRDLWMHCHSTILAGAEIRGGTVDSASDASAARPVEGPVRRADICDTIDDCLNIDPVMINPRPIRPSR